MTHESLSRLVRYGAVGVLTLFAYLGAGQVLSKLDVPISFIAPIAFLIAVLANYILQRKIVFLDRRPVMFSLPKYVLMVTVGLVVNTLVLTTLSHQIPLFWSQMAAAFVVVITNAMFAFLWVFTGAEKRKI